MQTGLALRYLFGVLPSQDGYTVYAFRSHPRSLCCVVLRLTASSTDRLPYGEGMRPLGQYR